MNTWNELPDTTALAVLLVDKDQRPLRALSQSIADRFRGSASLFTDDFIASGAFKSAISGNIAALSQLGLLQADRLLFGEVEIFKIADPRDSQLIIIQADCDAALYPRLDSAQPIFIHVSGRGVEYREDKARSEAVAELVDNLEAEVRMRSGPGGKK